MLYLLVVVMAGLWWGKGPSVLASVLGVLAFDFFFVPPHISFAVSDAQYLITFAALLGAALTIGTLTARLRDHAEALQLREQEALALYGFSRRLAAARDLAEVRQAVVDHVGETFRRQAALTVSLEGEPTGPDLRLPLRTPNGDVGTLVVGEGASLEPVQRRLLDALAAQAAVAVERAQLAEVARRAELNREAERLHDALLHSISHALRTPLSSIIGSLSALLDPTEEPLSPDVRKDLAETAREEAERLNGLVGNLLDMTRLEAGRLTLQVDWYDLEDVIGAALSQAERNLRGRPVRVELAEGLPLVPLDQVLIVQVLDNLLENAAKYSPPSTPVEIQVRAEADHVLVRVADRGPGIPPAELQRVFEKFYRVDRAENPSGTGLGLAICKGFVEAHHGSIWAEARAGGGTAITFTLPFGKGDEVDGEGARGR